MVSRARSEPGKKAGSRAELPRDSSREEEETGQSYPGTPLGKRRDYPGPVTPDSPRDDG